jgi:hypothetical protein
LIINNSKSEKKGSYSAIFEGVEQNLLGLMFNLEASYHFYREFALPKIYNSGAFILDNKQFKVRKRRIPIRPFLKELSKIFEAKSSIWRPAHKLYRW